jgi:hypothetical protein
MHNVPTLEFADPVTHLTSRDGLAVERTREKKRRGGDGFFGFVNRFRSLIRHEERQIKYKENDRKDVQKGAMIVLGFSTI